MHLGIAKPDGCRAHSMGVVLLIAVLDWRTKAYVSLDFLYLFPIMLAAGFLPRGESF
jgi:hypothetical protein